MIKMMLIHVLNQYRAGQNLIDKFQYRPLIPFILSISLNRDETCA